MRRLLTASLVLVFFVVGAAIAQAKSAAPTPRQFGVYRYLYRHARHKFGAKAVGCEWKYTCHGKMTAAKIKQSDGVLDRMLWPPPPPAPVATLAAPTAYAPQAATYTAPTYTSSSGGCGGNTPYAGGGQCWAIPYSIVQCESGGQNVPNSQGSGANGYYQLMVGGTGSRAEQDAAAHALWNGGAGASNWTCAGSS